MLSSWSWPRGHPPKVTGTNCRILFYVPHAPVLQTALRKKILLLHPVCGIVGDKWAMMVDDFEILLKYRSKGIVIKFHKLSHARKNPLLIQIKFL